MSDFLAQFEELLAKRTGLHVRAQDRDYVQQTVFARAQSRQLAVASYLEWLQSTSGANEWKHLFALLTNQESYFFRDAGQFELLRERILPELIAANRERRSLKLWSAGCSTGEEPYSLAMTLEELIPFRQGWNLEIHATDLSETALQKARNGIYSSWSFRNTPDRVRDNCFQKRGNDWILNERLRERVRFQHNNLRDDNFASQKLSEFDLILCRNVFIYFRRDAVHHVVQKFRDALRNGGYPLTGHAELHDVTLDDLQARTFTQSVIYQRVANHNVANCKISNHNISSNGIPNGDTSTRSNDFQKNVSSLSIPSTLPSKAISSIKINNANRVAKFPQTQEKQALDAKDIFAQSANILNNDLKNDELRNVRHARRLLREGQSADALQFLKSWPQNDSVADSISATSTSTKNRAAHLGALCLAAQFFANNARYDEALALCARAIEVDALSPLPYWIVARIAEEQGETTRAKELLKKVIYLAPQSALVMWELGAIYNREGDARRARSWRESALQALHEYSNEDIVPLLEWSLDAEQRVSDLRAHLQDVLEAA